MERLSLLFALAWRNLWRNPRRTGLILLAVGVGAWSMLVFTAVLQAWSASSLETTLRNLTGHGQIHAQGYLDNPGVEHRMPAPVGALRTLLDDTTVAHWAPRVRVPAAIQSEYETWPVALIGIDPARERGLSFIADALHDGDMLAGADASGILVGRKLAHRLHTGVGKRVVLMSQGSSGEMVERGFKVVGLFAASPEVEQSDIFVSIDAAQDMLNMGRDISEIAFDLHDLAALHTYIARLRAAAPGADVRSWETLQPMTHAVNEMMNAFVQLWIGVMFILMAFGIVNTLLMSLHERVRELALLQALGLRPQLIFAQVTLEAVLIVALGILAAMIAAALTLLAFRGGLDLGFLARGAEWFGAGRVLYLHISTQQFVGIALLVWLMGVVAGLLPTWRMLRRVPIDAINRG